MPEGDTVYRTATHLRPMTGERVTSATARPRPRLRRVPSLAGLVGASVTGVDAHGKHLLIRFDNGLTLRSHLRMAGSWRRYEHDAPWRRASHRATVILETDRSVAVVFDTPDVELLTDAGLRRSRPLVELGPDLLGVDVDMYEAMRRLRRRDATELGVALLDQRAVAGIGNVYKSEIAFMERLDPWAPVASFDDDQLRGALATARTLLVANRTSGARSTTGRSAAGQRLWVYRRAGRPCRRCGTTIRAKLQGTQPRFTWWCPRCQSAPHAVPDTGDGPTNVRDR